jgi:hypothetical protein
MAKSKGAKIAGIFSADSNLYLFVRSFERLRVGIPSQKCHFLGFCLYPFRAFSAA